MKSDEKWHKVFVSSTFKDLRDERTQISKALLESNCIPVGMELFPASDNDLLDLIFRIIDSCDFYLLVIAGRYGQMRSGVSYTELEFDYAVQSKHLPVLVFIQDQDTIPAHKCEEDSDKAKKLAAFREKAKSRGKSVRYWSNASDLASSIITSCATAISDHPDVGFVRLRSLVPASPYLRRFVETREPPLLECNPGQPIDGERAYALLRHMFQAESFPIYYALDLALERWRELVDDTPQIVNLSQEVIDNIGRMMRSQRCRHFYRLLVAYEDQFASEIGQRILAKIYHTELSWEKSIGDRTVVTRCLIYPRAINLASESDIAYRIAQLHDFALFRGKEGGELAIIETGLSTPGGVIDIRLSQFLLSSSPATLSKLESGFADLWARSAPIPSLLNQELIKTPSDRTDISVIAVPSNVNNSRVQMTLEALNEELQSTSRAPVIAVEGLYYDVRYPGSADRLEALADSCELVKCLLANEKGISRVLLSALVNNLTNTTDTRDCKDTSVECEAKIGDTLAPPERQSKWKTIITELFREQFGEKWQTELRIFSMTTTKNRLLRNLADDQHLGTLANPIRRQDAGRWIDVMIPTSDGDDIRLATWTKGERRGSARCAGLLAQHYHDLLQYAIAKVPELTDLFIVDFNRPTEINRVKKGAQATFSAFAWPRSVRVSIINVVCTGAPAVHKEVKSRY